jgi:hypothetical protein
MKEKAVIDKQLNDTNVVLDKNRDGVIEQWTKTDLKILTKPDKLKVC